MRQSLIKIRYVSIFLAAFFVGIFSAAFISHQRTNEKTPPTTTIAKSAIKNLRPETEISYRLVPKHGAATRYTDIAKDQAAQYLRPLAPKKNMVAHYLTLKSNNSQTDLRFERDDKTGDIIVSASGLDDLSNFIVQTPAGFVRTKADWTGAVKNLNVGPIPDSEYLDAFKVAFFANNAIRSDVKGPLIFEAQASDIADQFSDIDVSGVEFTQLSEIQTDLLLLESAGFQDDLNDVAQELNRLNEIREDLPEDLNAATSAQLDELYDQIETIQNMPQLENIKDLMPVLDRIEENLPALENLESQLQGLDLAALDDIGGINQIRETIDNLGGINGITDQIDELHETLETFSDVGNFIEDIDDLSTRLNTFTRGEEIAELQEALSNLDDIDFNEFTNTLGSLGDRISELSDFSGILGELGQLGGLVESFGSFGDIGELLSGIFGGTVTDFTGMADLGGGGPTSAGVNQFIPYCVAQPPISLCETGEGGVDDQIETLEENYNGSLMRMTGETTAMSAHRSLSTGSFIDADIAIDTQREFNRLKAQAHKDYHPSEQMCVFGSFTKSLARAEEKSASNERALNQALMSVYTNKEGSPSNKGYANDIEARLAHRRETNCDPSANNAGFENVCENEDVEKNQINRDVDFMRLVSMPRTLELDFSDGENTPDEDDIIAMARNLYWPRALDPAGKDAVSEKNFPAYMDSRRLFAMQNIAHSSFTHQIAMKSQYAEDGADNQSAPAFMKALLKDFGLTEEEIDQELGKNPSYFAQMEMLTKKMYQHPDFYTNLYDKPANVMRMATTMQALSNMQTRDEFELALRREMLLSLILEESLTRLESDISPRMDNLSRNIR